MDDISPTAPRLPRGTPLALAAFAALLVGAGLAGWFDHGADIFVAIASDAWAYCF